jgi:hypothetical protein
MQERFKQNIATWINECTQLNILDCSSRYYIVQEQCEYEYWKRNVSDWFNFIEDKVLQLNGYSTSWVSS